jgi:2-keto-3-deoxy-L-rhamnonate aldolase RhmA
MTLRQNRLRELLEQDRPLIGGHAMFADPAYVEFLGLSGFDWIFIDGEHFGVSVETCYQLVRAADAVGMASIVRIPQRDVQPHLGFAETGVNALMVPHLTTPEDAERLRSGLRFPPVGRRGTSGNTRAAGYGLGHTAAEYLQDGQHAIMVAAMIEDEVAVDNLETIVATGAVELYNIGLSDLAGSMGLPGQTTHPRVSAAYERAVATLSKHEQTFIWPAATAEVARSAITAGARMILASVPKIIGECLTGFAHAAR